MSGIDSSEATPKSAQESQGLGLSAPGPSDGVLVASDDTVVAAWLYYHEDMTQAQIADMMRTSRTSVANMLTRARATGVVEITVRSDWLAALSISKELRSRFQLDQVVTVPTTATASPAAVQRAIGLAGARLIEDSVRPGEIVLATGGATMYEVAMALSGRRIRDVTIVQALGGLPTVDHFNPAKVAWMMADKIGATVYHLFVPCVVESTEARDVLLRDRSIRAAFEVARSAQRAFLGIGKVTSDATIVRAGFLTELQIRELRAKGAVGDVMGRFFDVNGEPIESDLNERVMALELKDLRQIRPVVAVGGGPEKVEAIIGLIRGGYVDGLVVDYHTAQAVLDYQ